MPSVGIKGRDFLIKVGDGGGPEVFTTIGQLTATRLAINNTEVPITNKDSLGVQELFGEASIKSTQITGEGVFDDLAAAERLRVIAESGNPVANFELIDGTGDKYSGAFQVSSYEMGGGGDDAVTYSVTLSSAAAVPRGAV